MSDTPLAGRVAVVSGGGRGLGRSFCRALARQGAKVVVNNRNRVTDADGRGPADHVAAEIVAAAVERWGRLDICVANAAIGPGGMFHKQPAAQFGEVLEINLQGSVRLARAAMAVMRPAGYGRIILVGSTGGLHGDVGLSAYAASKGGLLAFGRSLAAEGAGKGVLTNYAAAVRPHPADRRRHAGQAHRQAATREAHGAVLRGQRSRVRSAHRRLHPAGRGRVRTT